MLIKEILAMLSMICDRRFRPTTVCLTLTLIAFASCSKKIENYERLTKTISTECRNSVCTVAHQYVAEANNILAHTYMVPIGTKILVNRIDRVYCTENKNAVLAIWVYELKRGTLIWHQDSSYFPPITEFIMPGSSDELFLRKACTPPIQLPDNHKQLTDINDAASKVASLKNNNGGMNLIKRVADLNPRRKSPETMVSKTKIQPSTYMATIQSKIKSAWKPPRTKESNDITVKFTIDTNGYIQDLQVITPCENTDANTAATDAVKFAAPFGRLPEGSPSMMDIEFTFYYNEHEYENKRW